MSKKIQQIKLFIKIAIVVSILFIIILLAFLVNHNHTYEKSNMKKWAEITTTQKIDTLRQSITNIEISDLLIACMDKIAELPNSNEMMVQNAASLCYNGIKLNEIDKEQTDDKK